MCMCRCAVHGLWGGPGKEPGGGGCRAGAAEGSEGVAVQWLMYQTLYIG